MLNFLLTHTPLFYLTQSLWRDEAFSILFAQRSPLVFFKWVFEPPFYYILLHYWIKIFGISELSARSLSLVGFMLATILVIYWAEKIYKNHWLSWFLPLFFFLNPMLLYFAFEVRAYGWYIFFAVASMYTFFEHRWRFYTISTLLGLFTHTYMIILPVIQFFHYVFIQKKLRIRKRFFSVFRDPMIRSCAVMTGVFGPWLIYFLLNVSKLSTSWYYPVNLRLVKSVLANIFLGYEGTPWFLWSFTANVSLVLCAIFITSLIKKQVRIRNSFFFLLIFIPLIITIGISYIKPLFVVRYFVPSTIAEIFLIIFTLDMIHNKKIQKILAASILFFVIGFNVWYPPLHPKLDIRNTVLQINALRTKQDVILVETPLIFFETIYYSGDESKVFYYNPENKPFPWYVGDIIVSPSQIVTDIPPYPIRAFIIHADATYEISYNAKLPSGKTIPPTLKSP